MKAEHSEAFEVAFHQDKLIIYPMDGLNAVQLLKHTEGDARYIL